MTEEGGGICAIMQPTFLPWAGYFNLIARSDYFIFLTDAEFSKGSWHNRNQILIEGKKAWLTCPVEHNGLHSLLNAISLKPGLQWRQKMARTLVQNYGKAPFFSETTFIIDTIVGSVGLSLAELNIELIRQISNRIFITSEFSESEHLHINLNRSKKLEALIMDKKCSTYLSPVGAKSYLFEDGVLPTKSIDVVFQDYVPREYKQFKAQQFVSHLSIFDVIANLGLSAAGEYVL